MRGKAIDGSLITGCRARIAPIRSTCSALSRQRSSPAFARSPGVPAWESFS